MSISITPRDELMLGTNLKYGFMLTKHHRDLFFPTDKDCSSTRDRLRKHLQAGFLIKRGAEVVNPSNSSSMPVWVITEKGRNLLAVRRNDASILNQHPPCTKAWHLFAHYAAVTGQMINLDRAVAAQQQVTIGDTFLEHTVVNPDETEAQKRYKLYTVCSESGAGSKRIVCIPDAAFELRVGNFRRPMYIEFETGSDSPGRVASKKAQGYAELAKRKLFNRHFPEAKDGFRVLCIVPNSSWRKAMIKAMEDKAGAALWMFAAAADLTPEEWLFGSVWYTCGKEAEGPRPLVRLPAPPVQGGVTGEGHGGGSK